jgi:DNA-binding response OmpR family regulator
MVIASPKIHELLKASPLAEEAGYQRPLLLLVEDHDDTRDLYRFVLERQGYRIIEAHDGEEAVRMAEALLPNLILMDSVLPLVDGVMAAIQIRQIPALHDVPIIFVSGQAETRRQVEALAAGGDEYLIKPLNLNELETAVERQLLKRRHATFASFARAS